MKKEFIFISHANPEDNIFAGWIAAKLTLEGYRVWCDLRSLAGGEDDLWGEIERVIRNESVKFIFITSHDSVLKRGTKRELALADGVRDIKDFIIPIRIQDVDYRTELPAEITRSLIIDFTTSWASGLSVLLDKLTKDCVPKNETSPLSSACRFWQDGQRIVASTITSKKERHWTNWFPIELPRCLYIAPVSSRALFDQRKTVTYAGCQYSFSAISSAHEIDTLGLEETEASYFQNEYNTQDVINGFMENSKKMPCTIYDARKALVQLCNRLIERGLQDKRLMVYPRTSGPNIYYITNKIKIPMKKYNRKNRILSGNYGDIEWHFGVSASTVLLPYPYVVLKSHVIFTKNKQLLDTNRQISARRHVCKMWFNDRWRDLLLALTLHLSDDQNEQEPIVSIPASMEAKILVHSTPIKCYSKYGYIEPVSVGAIEHELD